MDEYLAFMVDLFDDLLVNKIDWPHCRDLDYLCGHCRPAPSKGA